MHDSAHRRAVGQLLLTALIWSFGGLLIKSVDWPPLALAGGRGLLAALFLALTQRGLRFTFSRIQVLAAIAYAMCTVTFVTATVLTTAANAILLQYTAPVWVALFGSWLLGERATRLDWLAIAIVLAGMALFFADDLELANTLGIVLAIVSGIAFAAMTMALRRQKDGSPVESIILGNLFAFMVGLPFMVSAPPLSFQGLSLLAVLGIVQLGGSYWLYARAIKHVTALEAVLIPIIEPILNPAWVFLLRGEQPSFWALVGGTIVLGAVTGRTVWANRQHHQLSSTGD